MLHNHPFGGHFGVEIVAEKVKENYYWPQYYNDIKNYIKACDACQRRGKRRTKELLHPIEVGESFERIGINFVGPLPTTPRENRYIIVVIDYLTKWSEAKAVPEASAHAVVDFIYTEIIC